MYDLSNEDTRSPIISPWMATLVSVGVHGILGVVIPMIVSESEQQQTQAGVNILELTAAQQARLPSQSKTLPPLPLVPDELGSPSESSFNVPPSAAYYDPGSTSSLPSLNLPPLPPIPSYMDLSSLPRRTSSESILSRLAQNSGPPRQFPLASELNSGPPRQLPLPRELNSGPPRQLPLPPDLQIDNYGRPVLQTGGTVLGSDLQAYRPPAVNSPFSQLPQLEASAIDPQQLPELSELSEFQGLSAASVRTHVGPLPAKIPQQAIDELRRLQALNRSRSIEGTAAASIATGTTVELIPAPSGETVLSTEAERDPQGTASKPETTNNTAVPEKIPQRAIEELRRLQAQHRQELASTQLDSPAATVAAAPSTTPTVESPAVAPTQPTVVAAVPEKIPQRAIEELRRLQAQHRAELASTLSGTQTATAVAPLTTPTVESTVESTVENPPAAVPRKIPQQAIEALRRLQAQKREELGSLKPSDNEAATSPTVPPRASATVEKSPETVAAKPDTSESEAQPTGEAPKIPDRAIAQLRKLQQQLAYNPAETTETEALASIKAWLSESKKAASNPELLWEAKRITAEYPDVACRHGLDKNATDATLGVLVDPEGKISSQPEKIKSTGYALLNDIALEAASSYDFGASGEYKAYLLEIKFSHSESCSGTAASGQ